MTTVAQMSAGSHTAARYGLQSTAVLLPSESPAGYADLVNSVRIHFNPRDFSEERFVREMAEAEWSLARVRRHINQLFRCKYAEIANENPDFSPERVEFDAMQALHAEGSPLRAFQRHEAKYERQYRLAYEGLRRHRADSSYTRPRTQHAEKLTDEPNSTPRNAPCPCGSGIKYKRCCGKSAPPILNCA